MRRGFERVCAALIILAAGPAASQIAATGDGTGLGKPGSLGALKGLKPKTTLPNGAEPVPLDELKKKSPFINITPGLETPERLVGDLLTGTIRFPGPDPTKQTPAAPGAAADIVGGIEEQLRVLCGNRTTGECGQIPELTKVANDLRLANTTYPGCSAAVSNYLTYYPRRPVPAAVQRTYDQACLAASVPREALLADPYPTLLTAAAPGQASALRSIGLLEADGKIFCGALLRNDRTIVTARHCFDGRGGAYLAAGAVTVRPIDGRGAAWTLATTIQKQGAGGGKLTKDDWAVVAIDTTAAIGAADLPLASPAKPGAATVVGYFTGHTATPPPPGGADGWQRGVRWPKPGLCQVIQIKPGCLQLACQTVEGFSGAPIFSLAPGQSKPTVIGFVSRPATVNAGVCSTSASSITLAASAEGIG